VKDGDGANEPGGRGNKVSGEPAGVDVNVSPVGRGGTSSPRAGPGPHPRQEGVGWIERAGRAGAGKSRPKAKLKKHLTGRKWNSSGEGVGEACGPVVDTKNGARGGVKAQRVLLAT